MSRNARLDGLFFTAVTSTRICCRPVCPAHLPYGITISYGEQAHRIGQPSAVRAEGGANGRNRLPMVPPCHRVIGGNGSLIGFDGGLPTKRFLLALERRVARGDLFAGAPQ